MWKLKRVEHQLSLSWGIGMAYSNQFAKIPGMKNRFHRFYLAHQEMAHFVNNVHNYIMVEVLESSWKVYQDEVQQVKNLDELIDVQVRFSQNMLHKALLSEDQKDLNKILKKLLNNVYTFALIKERYFFKSALDEAERLKRVEDHENGALEEDLDEQDMTSKVNLQSIEQLDKMHLEFFNNFKLFKESLDNREDNNFKYIRCRLDFNLYYWVRYMQDMGGMDDDDVDDYGDDDEYGQEGMQDDDEDIG